MAKSKTATGKRNQAKATGSFRSNAQKNATRRRRRRR